jgi:hypothetical protein
LSAAAPAPRRRRKHFDHVAFEEMYKEAGKLDYTPDFNPAVEALIDMEDVALTERLMALIKLQAWGNQTLFAVHDDSRSSPFSEADCARRFKVSRQIINRYAGQLVERCRLRIEQGRLYPVPDPDAEGRARKAEAVNNGVDNPSPNLRLFKERYFAEHPELHEQYQKAFQFIADANRRIEAEFRATISSAVSPTGVTAPPEAPKGRAGHEDDNGPDTEAAPSRTLGPPNLIEKNRTIEEVSGPEPAASEIVKTVELLCGALSPTDPLKTKFNELAARFEIPARSVCRFLLNKVGEKQRDNYAIQSAGALYEFALRDLKLWLSQHRRDVEADFRHEERKPPVRAEQPDELALEQVDEIKQQMRAAAASKGAWK